MFFERVLFGTLGAIGEATVAKVVPKGSQKLSKRDNFEARVDFSKQWFYPGKTSFFEVLEVFGDDLETLSEMETAKRVLERGLRVPFCRFGQILEILRVLLGGHLGSNY